MNESLQRLLRPDLRNFAAYSAAAPNRDAIRLHANESPYPCGDEWLNRYPEPQPGLLLEKLARLYSVDRTNVLATRGSDDGIDLLVRCFCRAGEDSIIICPPTFGMYEVAARLQNAAVIRVPLEADNAFLLDPAAIATSCTEYTRLVFLCTPNNPTGNVIDRQTITDLCQALRQKALVVVDEAYIEFAGAKSLASYVDDYPNLVVLRTLSKAHGLAGARCGALIATPEIIQLLAPALPPYALPTPTVTAALEALSDSALQDTQQRITLVRNERDQLRTQLERLPVVIRTWPGQGNFLLTEVRDRSKVIDACSAKGILIRDMGAQSGLNQHVRITVGTAEQNRQLLTLLGTLS